MSNSLNISMIKDIAMALGELKDEVVFVGGAVVSLYIDDVAAPTPNPSEDIDCVVEIASYSEWQKLEKVLREKNFKDMRPGEEAPKNILCRKYYLKTIVDFMPIEKDILGMTNSWFKEGFQNKKEIKLPGTDLNIYIFTLPYFLASKIEAYNGRGLKGDPRESQDLEDISQMLDGCTKFEAEFNEGNEKVKLFIRDNFKKWLEEWDIYSEAIGGFLAYESKEVRIDRIYNILNKIIS